MQSFRQYRKFRTHLEAEIQRHGVEQVTKCATPRDISLPLSRWQSLPQTQQQPKIDPVGSVRDHAQEEAQLGCEKPEDTWSDVDKLTSVPNRDSHTEPPDSLQRSNKNSKELESPNDDDSSSDSTTAEGYETEEDREHSNNVRSVGTRLGQSITGISIQSRASKMDDLNVRGHVFVVGYQGPDDQMNPHNWSTLRKTIYTIIIANIGFVVGLASSIDSAAIPQASIEFGVSEVVESLATGLFLVGFGCGAFFAAPLSETIGRNPIYLGTGAMYMIFVMASALSPNIGAQLAFRFIAGFFGSTPLTCAGGSISDMWGPVERTAIFPMFAYLSFIGPAAIGPAVGGFIAESSLISWRWVDWITLIWSGLVFGFVFIALPETYTPVLLKWKAQHLRKLTGDDRYKSIVEIRDDTLVNRLLHALYRPWLLMLFEPTIQLFTLYMSIVYIILFTFLTGFPYIFQETYGISQGLTFLIFLGLGVGFTFTYALVPFITIGYKHRLEAAKAQGRQGLPPEQRLIIAMIAAPWLPVGIFWMAWTAYPSVSIWAPIIASVPVGFGTLGIFIATYQYVIDSYEAFAASGLVGLTFVRYCVAGGMIPVSIPFYKNLGVHWTLTILGALSLIMVPVPFMFFKFGPQIRKRSRRAVKG